MALKGTLADMAIIDLVQFPHAGRKTGQLIISGPKSLDSLRGSFLDPYLPAYGGEAVSLPGMSRVSSPSP